MISQALFNPNDAPKPLTWFANVEGLSTQVSAVPRVFMLVRSGVQSSSDEIPYFLLIGGGEAPIGTGTPGSILDSGRQNYH